MKTHAASAALAAAALALPASAQATLLQHESDGMVSAAVSYPAGGVGWQSYQKFSIPAGQNLMFTYQCPASAPVAVNGAFYANKQARVGLSLVSNFRAGQDAAIWEWIIYWPSGAPPKAQISFNVYCNTN